MKRILVFALILLAGATVQAQNKFEAPRIGFGFSGGGAQGTNDATDRWVLIGRGYLQHNIFGKWFKGQLGGGYTKLQAQNYWAKTAFADYRLLIVPASGDLFAPYIFAGGGVTKAVYRNGTSYLGALPLGAGIQSRIASNFIWTFNAGFYLSLSDSLDGRARSNADLNALTNGRNDGFYFFETGLIVGTSINTAASAAEKRDRVVRTQMELLDEPADEVGVPSAELDPFADSAPADTTVTELFAFMSPAMPDTKSVTIPISTAGSRKVWRTISFGFNDSTLSREGAAILQEVAAALMQNPAMRIEIAGHSDDVGSAANNVKISLARANMVKAWLTKMGVDASRLQPTGRGEAEPIADNGTSEGRAANRRVEFLRWE